MSSAFVLNVDKPLTDGFLNRKIEVCSVVPQSAEVREVDGEIGEKLKRYNLSGFNYILGNQFMSFQKTTGSFYYKDERVFAEWLRALTADLIRSGFKVSLISAFYGDEIGNPKIKTQTLSTNELIKDDLILEYYTVYRIDL
jgi:hypothetical protein